MRTILPLLLLIFSGFISFSQSKTVLTPNATICLSQAEADLAQMINSYRKTRKLPAIPLSTSLSKVAQLHAKDLYEHYTPKQRCNLHSWSSNPLWSSCCYTPDHKQADCMWDKPRELTSYKGDGYEIAYFSSGSYPNDKEFLLDALDGWKGSNGHHAIIINSGTWKTAEWKAMGVGIYEGYVTVWFGELTDHEPTPNVYRY